MPKSFLRIVIASVLLLAGFILVTSLHQNTICANSLSCEESLNLSVDNGETGVFEGQKITPPTIDLAAKENTTQVLGEADSTGEKHIYVDLAAQTLTAYNGETMVMQVPVSTGRWGKTPTGEFTIWKKIRATKMSGGSGADYYYLPNVPYVMFFSNSQVAASRGFSFHGAYWHNNFGHTMSHGCVNMRTIDAEKLYNWIGEDLSNVKITIHD
ncbi:MAG TPA: L,D-transpeptidase [Alphaproteobacteria bacterium]|jgi:lipoprotein-anchoring transpeptidase ErfK/SrfK|nr:L,D-transpeptidase [Alphaproteobacteria bacterium]